MHFIDRYGFHLHALQSIYAISASFSFFVLLIFKRLFLFDLAYKHFILKSLFKLKLKTRTTIFPFMSFQFIFLHFSSIFICILFDIILFISFANAHFFHSYEQVFLKREFFSQCFLYNFLKLKIALNRKKTKLKKSMVKHACFQMHLLRLR